MILKVTSGGQTGADQAGLRAARQFGIETGGFAPRGWITETGEADWLRNYGLTECPKPKGPKPYEMERWQWDAACYAARTKMNAEAADATLWFESCSLGDGKGFECTRKACVQNKRPLFIIGQFDRSRPPAATAAFLKQYWSMLPIEVVNIAGNRESKSPGIGQWVERHLVEVFELLDFVQQEKTS